MSNLDKIVENIPIDPGFMDMERYYHSAVLVPVVSIGGKEHILFEKRAMGIRQEGEVCFPGGGVDYGEDLYAAVIRECFEELGILKENIEIIKQLPKILNPMAGAYVEPVLGRIRNYSESHLKINISEVSKVFTVPLEYFINNPPEVYYVSTLSSPFEEHDDSDKIIFPAKELNLPKIYHNRWAVRKHKVFVWKTDEVIWGLTAKIIKRLVEYFR
ncbi:MAG: CoA pyrophosphatase [Candidatus Delongbacteria bacterium]|nr:CoA pyrophosphatase [Candidatus Delongbacteria bacterium]MBN2835324.1 CoA pyrophosphatase [Candidatus Delongbacteria bacterium]